MGGGGVGEEMGKGKRKRNSAYLQETEAEEPKRTRVHAQRKFAQGAGGGSPQVSPLKEVKTRTRVDNGSSSSSTASGPSFPAQKGTRPKTEDFLTFLCLRGTDLLPPELDFFNQATTTQGHESSDESFSDQDDPSKDPEVDKNGLAKKSTPKRLAKEGKPKKEPSTVNSKKKESDAKSVKEDKKLRKPRSGSQDSASSPERKAEPRTTRSQADVTKDTPKSTSKKGIKEKKGDLNTSNRESRAAARQQQKVDSSDESSSEHEAAGGRKSQLQKSESEADADEEASSRESSRRPNCRRSEDLKALGKDSLSRLKAREGRSTSRDSSASKESLAVARPARGTKDAAKAYLHQLGQSLTKPEPHEEVKAKGEPESGSENGADNGFTIATQDQKDDASKSPKEKKEKKKEKKHKNKSKNSLKDLQNILLEEAKRNIAEPQNAMQSEPTKRPSTSPEDSEGNSEERIPLAQRQGYTSVKSRASMDQQSEEGSVGSQSPQRRNSGALSRVKSTDRVPTPPRKILPKGNSEPQGASAEPPVTSRTNHLPVGVMGAAGLSNRLNQPTTSKAQAMVTTMAYSSPPSDSTFSQPLLIQTSMGSSQHLQTTMSSLPNTATAQPTIIMPGQQVRMPVQMSAVPIMQGIRPGGQVIASGGYQGMPGIPILGPAGVQFGIPVQAGQVQVRTQHQAVVTVPTFIRSGFTYGQPIMAGTSSQPQAASQMPQTITMPSGTTIQYNVPPTSIRQGGLPQASKAPSTAPSTSLSNYVISTSTSSPLVSPGPPTLSPQIASQRSPPSGAAITPITAKLAAGPPTLTPPVRKEEPRARRGLNMEAHRAEPASLGQCPVALPSPTEAAPAFQSAEPQRLPTIPPGDPSPVPQALFSPYPVYSNGQPVSQGFPGQSSPGYPQAYHSPGYGQPSPQGSYHSSHSPGLYMSPPALHISSPPQPFQPAYPQAYPMSPVQYQYNQASQPAPPPPAAQPLHSPLTHSSAQYRSSSQTKPASTQPDIQTRRTDSLPAEKARKNLTPPEKEVSEPERRAINRDGDQKGKVGEAANQQGDDDRLPAPPGQPAAQQSNQTPKKTEEPSGAEGSSSRKKHTEKQITSKLGDSRNRLIKPINVEDNSSPYAFDFEGLEEDTTLPFRKSSSPLKPQAMIKKTMTPSQREHADLKPTGSSKKLIKQDNSAKSTLVTTVKPEIPLEIKCDMESSVDEAKPSENPDPDASSSDNETTYFIPLQNSTGQSFGVAVKLGTDGPSGPNQKVIMTAKLVTSPNAKPTKAKILGAKKTETPKSAEDGVLSPGQSTSTPAKDATTPRKMRMPIASPVAPNRLLDEDHNHLHSSPAKPRMRRALSPDSGRSSCSQVKDSSSANTSQTGKKRPMCLLGQVNTGHRFPRLGQHAEMMEAPTFRPTEDEFKDPLRYIQKIRPYAEQFGMCRIVPPKSFKPECNVDDDMRFTGYNQYINRMFSRWGPNAKETAAIKKYLETQNVDTRAHPLVGGLEVDLPALYHAVQSFGGLGEVIQKKKWSKIAEYLRVSRGSNSNVAGNKLDDIYVKWLLPYDTLSPVEREELLRLVEEEWAEQSREKAKKLQNKDNEEEEEEEEDEEEEDEEQEAVVKGKATSLTAFYRLSANLMKTVFRNDEPSHYTVEDEYWKVVGDKDVHMQVSQGSIDTGMEGFGFPIRNSTFATHPWNLKVLTKSSRSILRAMGSVMGVTQPTLHVGMLFTTGCWYRDPHGLPWIEYLHSGAPKIWYGIPDDHSLAFYTAMKQLVPSFCKNQKIWLPSDTTMVSPSLLVKHGVSVCRAVQQPRQFVVVFPKSYTSSLCTGYCVSESVYYAPGDWLRDVDPVFQDIKDSMEPMMFPLEKMLFALAADVKSTKYVLETIKPKVSERLNLASSGGKDQEDDEYECQVCNANLFVSLIANEEEDSTFCVEHGMEYVRNYPKKAKSCKLMYTHTQEEICEILRKVVNRLREGHFLEEHEEDPPITEDDILDVEDEDYVEEEDIKPRERALPSYIKKEKGPLISSESEDEDEEEEVEEHGPQITEDDYLEDFPEEDINVIEALFAEDDEVVRKSTKRKAPTVRAMSESSEEDEENEDEEEVDERKSGGKKPDSTAMDKQKEDSRGKIAAKAKEAEKKRKLKEKEKQESQKQREKEKIKNKRKREEAAATSSTKKKCLENKNKSRSKNNDSEEESTSKNEKSLEAKEVKKNEAQKNKTVKGKEKNNTTEKKSEVKKGNRENQSGSRLKESEKVKGKPRKSNKRSAKGANASDQFNLLDIYLADTDDEHYQMSASDKESEEQSSDEEWK